MDWQGIQQGFRGSFEGAVWAFLLVVVLLLSLPLLSHLFGERIRRLRRLRRIQTNLSTKGIRPEEWILLQDAIQATCPDNPDRLLGSVSLFNTWVDGLPGIDHAEPELLATLQRIKELTFPDTPHGLVPHSTRDLCPGTSLNLVHHKGGQEVVPCIVTEVAMDGLRLVPRQSAGHRGLAGEQVSLFYPRPEAMYHAIVTLKTAPGNELRTTHAQQGQFRVRQLREFWRVDVDMDVPFMVLGEAGQARENGPGSPAPSRLGRMINLSGNGAAIVTRTPPPRGARISFPLVLPSKTLHDLQAEVLHVSEGAELSRLHLVFRNLDPGDQELIIRNLFLIYREQAGLEPLVEISPVITQIRS
jgi:hypothetical protein